MVHLGDRLGLYKAIADAGRPLTSTELAESTGLVERWVREWLYSQGAARLLESDGERFWMSPEAVAVLADEDARAVPRRHLPRPPPDDAAPRRAPGELPHRPRSRLRQPRTGAGDGHRARVRAVDAQAPRRRRDPPAGRGRGPPRRRHPRRRYRVRCGRRGDDARRGVPGELGRRLRHLPPRARPRPPASRRAGPDERRLRRCRRITVARRRLVRSGHRVRLPPRHDRPGGHDVRHQGQPRPTTAPGCWPTSRPTTPTPRTSSATRWRR